MYDPMDILKIMSIEGMGPCLYKNLIDKFGDPEQIIPRLKSFSTDDKSIPSGVLSSVHSGKYLEFFNKHRQWMKQSGAHILTLEDPLYPDILKHIYDPPPLITFLGEWDLKDNNALAIVGTRHPDHYGKRITRDFTHSLVNLDITIISGLAKGVDSVAHYTAVRSGKRTIAVLGTPPDIIYPAENQALVRQICNNGVVLSEFVVGHKTAPGCFVRRNRLISGLSRGVIVTQAGDKSGALATAFSANEQNREVFAVPGNIYTGLHDGCHRLIKKGAKLVEKVEDILEELPILMQKCSPQLNLITEAADLKDITESGKLILNILSKEPLYVDDILQISDLNHGKLMSVLLQLELKGYIQQLPGKFYIRKI